MILVTGGTGFVGREAVMKLLALGYRVRLLVRNTEHASMFRHHPGVECLPGDALKPETLPPAMAGVEAVVHLIGIIAETSKVSFEEGHTEATRHLLTAAREAGVTRWIHLSAIGTRPQARSRYHTTKWEAEELVRKSGLDWTIFRASLIYGYDERDRLLNFLRTVLSGPVSFLLMDTFPFLLNGGEARIQPVSVREVAHVLAAAVANEPSIAKTYDLVGPASFSWREMVMKVAAALGKKAFYENFPIFVLLRALLRLSVVVLPIGVIWAMCRLGLSFPAVEILGAGWVGLAVTAYGWRTVLVFSLPSAGLMTVGNALASFLPRHLQFGEQLKMAEENNVGDPVPAMETFDYKPESFEEGLARIFGPPKPL